MLVLNHNKQGRTLNEVLASLAGDFFIVTKKVKVNRDELLEFVNEARAKNMNDFNIASIVKHESGFLTTYLR
jgi:hypothetical protein